MSGTAREAERALEAERRRQQGEAAAGETLKGGPGSTPVAPPKPRPGGESPDSAS